MKQKLPACSYCNRSAWFELKDLGFGKTYNVCELHLVKVGNMVTEHVKEIAEGKFYDNKTRRR